MVISWTSVLLVALGGSIGSVLRALLSTALNGWLPWGTFAVNLLGCLLIGLLLGWGGGPVSGSGITESSRFFWVVGFCGGFTTFSAFSFENVALLEQGRFLTAFAYILLSVVLCVAGAWAGFRLGRLA